MFNKNKIERLECRIRDLQDDLRRAQYDFERKIDAVQAQINQDSARRMVALLPNPSPALFQIALKAAEEGLKPHMLFSDKRPFDEFSRAFYDEFCAQTTPKSDPDTEGDVNG